MGWTINTMHDLLVSRPLLLYLGSDVFPRTFGAPYAISILSFLFHLTLSHRWREYCAFLSQRIGI